MNRRASDPSNPTAVQAPRTMSQPLEQGTAAPATDASTAPAVASASAVATAPAAATSSPALDQAAEMGPDAAATGPGASQATLPPSQPMPGSSPMQLTPSDAMPLTQEQPPATQSTVASMDAPPSDANTAAPSPSVPLSQATQPIGATQETGSVLSQPSAAASTSTAASSVTDAAHAGDATSTPTADTPMDVDPASFAAPNVNAASQPFAKVEPEHTTNGGLARPTTPDLAAHANGSHPVPSSAGAPNGALATPSPTVGSVASVAAGPPAVTGPAATAAPVAPAAPATAAASPAKRGPPGPVQMSSSQIKFAQTALRSLKIRAEARWFLDPVDPVALNIPRYLEVVKEPMDLGTIDYKLSLTSYARTAQAAGSAAPRPSEKVRIAMSRGLNPERDYYSTPDDFVRDVNLVFDNCALFNQEDHPIAKQGRELQQVFAKQMKGMPAAEPEVEKKAAVVPPPHKPRTPSTSIAPAARRSSTTDANGRPKREIIPPASRDLPWDDEPQSATSIAGPSIAKKRRRTTLTPREQAYYARINSEDLRFAQKVMDELYKPAHQNVAWVFYDLPDTSLDFAPAYYEMIKKPTSMRKIQMQLKAGEFADLAEFDANWQLLFKNCFTFNPPDTDVYVMGKKMKEVYEEKMRKRPEHPPLSPDPMEDTEMVDADDEKSRLAAIQAQIARLEAEAASLKKDGKPVKTKAPSALGGPSTKKAKTSAATAAVPPVFPALNGSAAKAAVEPAAPKPAKKKASKPKEPNGAATGGSKKKAGGSGAGSSSPSRKTSSAAGGSNGAPKKRRESQPAKVVETFQEISYPQKEELAMKIQELPEDRLDGALSIIAEDKPPSAGDQDEIELDIDAISPKTLYKLYTYVVGPLPPPGGAAGAGVNGAGHGGAADAGLGGVAAKSKKKNAKKSKPASGAGAADGRKRGTGGLKRKNLDEEEEAQRIASLRQQLNQFNSGDASTSASVSALPVDGAHDDLVHSDSSSGDESGSDSESDFD